MRLRRGPLTRVSGTPGGQSLRAAGLECCGDTTYQNERMKRNVGVKILLNFIVVITLVIINAISFVIGMSQNLSRKLEIQFKSNRERRNVFERNIWNFWTGYDGLLEG